MQKLETNGVVSKSTDRENGSKYIYSLTEKGKALLPSMVEVPPGVCNLIRSPIRLMTL